ncbi:Crp/Fnr family transcriptional regulator [Paenibacillus sp. MAHUQ-46]|uniref:Crp/Fnr family transcriptional regulator n=2 Tax=Paenibacillus TaxID=44249 RepID=A0A934MPS3_9BACL|nr:Crp/Fnr family transcriptional regulator [Paenibacillus roseus]MBJ6362381.1 Crp/Fnr family transcriptional regulator [Paenibacillus roseus]
MPVDQQTLRLAVPFFEDISPEVLERIVPFMYERTFKKNSIIFIEGDEGEEIYFIRSGSVNIYSFDGSKKVILAVLQKGEYFGEMAAIRPGLVRSATAETASPTKLFTLRRRDFEKLIEQHPQLAFQLLEYSMERLRQANQQIYDLTFLNVKTRIMKRLIRLSQEYGVTEAAGIRIDAKLTHQQIAEMVGAARETVTKVLQELQEEGNILIRNKWITLPDRERLKSLLQEEI